MSKTETRLKGQCFTCILETLKYISILITILTVKVCYAILTSALNRNARSAQNTQLVLGKTVNTV